MFIEKIKNFAREIASGNLSFKEKIFTRPIWKPLHLLSHFKKNPKMNLKNAEEIYDKVINLPSGSKL